MEKIIVMPPKLNGRFNTYNYLASLQNTIIDCPENQIILDFRQCTFSHAIFTSFIGSLAVWAKGFDKSLVYRVFKDSQLNTYFKRSGLFNFITGDTVDYTNGNAIPFREVHMDDESIMDYIDNILNLAPINLTGNAKGVLFKNIYEIFINSTEHSGAQKGVYACGHWMPKQKRLVFSVYDTGIGIPAHIKSNVDSKLSSTDAIEWALVKGNSTKQLDDGTPRGLGLSDLKKFIELNSGTFTIVSNDVYYSYDKNITCSYLEKPIIGTIVSFTICNDEKHIYFA